MKAKEAPVTTTQSFDCSAFELWNAISKSDEMRHWFFDNIPDFEPECGFETKFIIENEGRVFTHQWVVVAARINEQLSYKWSYAEYSGEAVVHFSLQGSKPTVLTVSMEVTEDFPDDVPEFTRESCQGGWDYFINESLVHFLLRKD